MGKQEALDKIFTGHAFSKGGWAAVKVIASAAYDAGMEAAGGKPLELWEYELLNDLSPAAPPKVGDLVRVREGASHVYCAGYQGTLGYEDEIDEYWVPGHSGPLSDFEKVEGN